MTIRDLVNDFVLNLSELMVGQLCGNASNSVDVIVGGKIKQIKLYDQGGVTISGKDEAPGRKSRKKVLCPIQRCQNVSAPIYGHVCSKHKDLPKSVIKQERKARKARKASK